MICFIISSQSDGLDGTCAYIYLILFMHIFLYQHASTIIDVWPKLLRRACRWRSMGCLAKVSDTSEIEEMLLWWFKRLNMLEINCRMKELEVPVCLWFSRRWFNISQKGQGDSNVWHTGIELLFGAFRCPLFENLQGPHPTCWSILVSPSVFCHCFLAPMYSKEHNLIRWTQQYMWSSFI
jgi:hypothetical protein